MVAIQPFFNIGEMDPASQGGYGSLSNAIQSAMEQARQNQAVQSLSLSNQAQQIKMPFLRDQIQAEIQSQQLKNQLNQILAPNYNQKILADIAQKNADSRYKNEESALPGLFTGGPTGDIVRSKYYASQGSDPSGLSQQMQNAIALRSQNEARQANPLTEDEKNMLQANNIGEGNYYNAKAQGFSGSPTDYIASSGGDPKKRPQVLSKKSIDDLQKQSIGRELTKYLQPVINRGSAAFSGMSVFGFNAPLLLEASMGHDPDKIANAIVSSALNTPAAIAEVQNLGANATTRNIQKVADTLAQGIQTKFGNTPFGPEIMNLVKDKVLYHLLEGQHRVRKAISQTYTGIEEPDKSAALDKTLYVNPLWRVSTFHPDVRPTMQNGRPTKIVAVRDRKTKKVYQVPYDQVAGVLDSNPQAEVVER